MPSFVHRNGQFLEADEAFGAWTSGDLRRMLAARSVQTNPIDRHFLLQSIVGLTYKQRSDNRMRDICLETAKQHLVEFPGIAPALANDLGGSLPRVSTFAYLATVLAEGGQFAEAISVCENAIKLGLHDGTKGDFAGRITRLQKAASKRNARAG